MANRFADGFGPKGNDGNSAAHTAQVTLHFNHGSKLILLGEIFGNRENVVLSPANTGAMKGPQVVRRGLRIGERSVEAVAIQIDGIELYFALARIANRGRDQCD